MAQTTPTRTPTRVPRPTAAAQDPSLTRRRARSRLSILGAALASLVILVACGGQGNSRVPPQAPSSVTASGIAGGVRVGWVDGSDNEDEFIVYRREVISDEELEDQPELSEVARVSANILTYEDFAVELDRSYLYAVAASNAAGVSELAHQPSDEPVSPAVGVTMTVTFDGSGLVEIDDGESAITCSSDCVRGFVSGTSVNITATGAEGNSFAGWAGDCSLAGACTVLLATDVEVEARFRRRALHLLNTGDSPVTADIGVEDVFGNKACILAGGESCAFGYDFDGTLQQRINIAVLESGAEFRAFGGDCTAPAGQSCLVDVESPTTVEIEVVRVPVASEMDYGTREDNVLDVAADEGLLTGVSDTPGDVHTALLESGPANGSLSLNPDGSFTYTPNADYFGTDSFEFRARDAHGNMSQAATANLAVAAVNDAPRFELAGNPPATVGHGNPVGPIAFATGLHPGADNEAEQTLSFDITPVSGADLVTGLTVDISGTSASLTYTPVAGTYGTATYEVRLKDSGGTANGGADTSAPQTLTITVSPVTLTVNSTAGGTLDPTVGVHEYSYGTDVTVTASAADKYLFAGWTGSGACAGLTNPCHVSMTANKTIAAQFQPIVSVIFGPSPTGTYRIESQPGGISNCWAGFPGIGTCSAPFPLGEPVTLISNGGNRQFAEVTCEEGTPTSACTFTVTEPVTVTVSND